MDVNFESLCQAMALINDYSLVEFGSYADFSNLKDIGLAFTTDEDDNEIQVSVNLEDCTLTWECRANPTRIMIYHYDNLEQMIETQLKHLDFGELIADDF